MTETLPMKTQESGAAGDSLVAIAAQTRQIREVGETLLASGLLPDGIKKPEAAVAIMLKSRELGIGPMYALSHIAIIKGKPTLSANLMTALVKRAGHRLRVLESTDESCTVEGERRDAPGHPERVTWTEEDAKRAGLWGQGAWKSYPRALLKARAITALCGTMFADVLSGVIYTPEELGAVVDDEGQVVEAPDREPAAEPVKEAEVVEEEPDEEEHEEVAELLDEFPAGTGPKDPRGRPLATPDRASAPPAGPPRSSRGS